MVKRVPKRLVSRLLRSVARTVLRSVSIPVTATCERERVSDASVRRAKYAFRTPGGGQTIGTLSVAKYPSASACIETGLPFTRSGACILDPGLDNILQEGALAERRVRRFPTVTMAGDAASIHVRHRGYYHLWVDVLPRAWLLTELCDTTGLRLLVRRGEPAEFYEALEALGGGRWWITRLPRFVRVRPSGDLYVPDIPNRSYLNGNIHDGSLPIGYVEAFRSRVAHRFVSYDDPPAPGVFVSRSLAASRRLVNEAEVATALAGRGVSTIRPETMSQTAQAAVFGRASVLVASHGAALANLIYMRPGAAVVEIFHGPTGNPHYERLAASFGIRYHAVQLEEQHKDADAVLDPNVIDTLVMQLLHDTPSAGRI